MILIECIVLLFAFLSFRVPVSGMNGGGVDLAQSFGFRGQERKSVCQSEI